MPDSGGGCGCVCVYHLMCSRSFHSYMQTRIRTHSRIVWKSFTACESSRRSLALSFWHAYGVSVVHDHFGLFFPSRIQFLFWTNKTASRMRWDATKRTMWYKLIECWNGRPENSTVLSCHGVWKVHLASIPTSYTDIVTAWRAKTQYFTCKYLSCTRYIDHRCIRGSSVYVCIRVGQFSNIVPTSETIFFCGNELNTKHVGHLQWVEKKRISAKTFQLCSPGGEYNFNWLN